MNAHAHLRAQLNVIHGELAARGIHSPKIESATDSIETLTRAYMDAPETHLWAGLRFAPKERRLINVLYKHLGKNVSRDRILDAMFFDHHDGTDHLVDPRKHVDVFVCGIRKKIAKSPYEIKTYRGQGFAMVPRSIPKPVYNALDALSAA